MVEQMCSITELPDHQFIQHLELCVLKVPRKVQAYFYMNILYGDRHGQQQRSKLSYELYKIK